jgi:hypothetical protein
MILLAWRFLQYQKDSALAQWFYARTSDGRGGTRKTMIVALARKLPIAFWRLVMTGEMPNGVAFVQHDEQQHEKGQQGNHCDWRAVVRPADQIRGGGDPDRSHGWQAVP